MANALPISLANQALDRLRKYADGNGLAPEKIILTSAEEQIYTLEGVLSLAIKHDIQRNRYPGGPRGGKGRQIFLDIQSLQAELQRRQEEFQKGGKWIQGSVQELKTAPGEGWGLEGAHVTLPDSSITLAAGTLCLSCHGTRLLTCPQCNGQGYNLCTHCHGSRMEGCFNCGGSGRNPSQPDQACPVCNGNRTMPCRFCRASGQIACPTCHGRRGVACSSCKGTGQITEEVTLTCGAETHFKLSGEGLPSGLRRGLDRLGIANLVKGHADIETLPPKKDQEPPDSFRDAAKGKNYTPALNYRAKLPYADLRISFNGKKALVGAFGKKCVLLNVPSFLDDALEPWRDKLKQAARGKMVLDAALGVRAIREALALELEGKANIKELRRNYPVGLSADTAKEILGNIRLAINKVTLRLRSVMAVACWILSGVLFGGVFFTPLHEQLVHIFSYPPMLAFDIGLPLGAMGLSWLALSASARFLLRKRFRHLRIALRQKSGKTGYAMLIAIAVLYAVIYAVAKYKAGIMAAPSP